MYDYTINLAYEEMVIDVSTSTAVARTKLQALHMPIHIGALLTAPVQQQPEVVAAKLQAALTPQDSVVYGATNAVIELMLRRVYALDRTVPDDTAERVYLRLYAAWLFAIDHALRMQLPLPPCPSRRVCLDAMSRRAIAAALLVSVTRAGTHRVDMVCRGNEHEVIRVITGTLTPPRRIVSVDAPASEQPDASHEVTLDDLEALLVDDNLSPQTKIPVLWTACWTLGARVVAATAIADNGDAHSARQNAIVWASSFADDWSPDTIGHYAPEARELCSNEMRLIMSTRYAVLDYVERYMPDLRDAVGALSTAYYFNQLVRSSKDDYVHLLRPTQDAHPSQFVTYMDSFVLPRRLWDAVRNVMARSKDVDPALMQEMEYLETKFDAATYMHTFTTIHGAVEFTLVPAQDWRRQLDNYFCASAVIRGVYSNPDARRMLRGNAVFPADVREFAMSVPARCAPSAMTNYYLATVAIRALAEERGINYEDPDRMCTLMRTLIGSFYQTVMGNPQFSAQLRYVQHNSPRLYCILGAVARAAEKAWATCVFNVLPRQWTENQMSSIFMACVMDPRANDMHMPRCFCVCSRCFRVLTPLALRSNVITSIAGKSKRIKDTLAALGLSRSAIDIFARFNVGDVLASYCQFGHADGPPVVLTEDIVGKVFRVKGRAYVRCANPACSRSFQIEPLYSNTNYAGLVCAHCATVLREKREQQAAILRATAVDLTHDEGRERDIEAARLVRQLYPRDPRTGRMVTL